MFGGSHEYIDAMNVKNGRWRKPEEIAPQTNMARRLYRAEDGTIHRALTLPLHPPAVLWWFPDKNRTDPKRESVKPIAKRRGWLARLFGKA